MMTVAERARRHGVPTGFRSATGLLAIFGLLLCNCGSQSAAGGEGSGDGTDSSTHWLEGCSKDADCGRELSCECGVCTLPCTTTAGCEDLGDGAQCLPVTCRSANDTVESGQCSKACERDRDCGEASSCDDGVCVPEGANAHALDTLDGGPGATYDACAGLSCGDACSPCEPSDPACDATGDSYACTAAGDCVSGRLTCGEPGDGGPQDISESCDFLAETKEASCGGRAELCEQMTLDGREHAVQCEILSGGQGEQAGRSDCVADWLYSLGASAVTSGNSFITAVGTMDELEPVFTRAALDCTPACEETTCDYCFDLDENACAADPFCSSYEGKPTNPERECLEASEFAACMPAGSTCTDAFTAKLDTEGRCWVFSRGCATTTLQDPASSDTCAMDLIACDAGCDAPTLNDGETACGFGWNGTECTPADCSCDPSTASCGAFGYSPTLDECRVQWAGCTTDIPFCSANRMPGDGRTRLFNHDLPSEDDEEGNPPPYSDWTPAEWTAPFELPITPVPCPEAEGSDPMDCPSPKGLAITQDGVELFQIDVSLPQQVWSRLDVEVGMPIDVRVTGSEFAVRDRATQQPILLVGRGGQLDASRRGYWVVPPFEVEAYGAFCKRVPEESECNWLDVVQYLNISAPPREPDSEELGLVDITLEPLRSEEFTVPTTGGESTYRISYDQSISYGNIQPTQDACAALRPRADAFSLARVR